MKIGIGTSQLNNEELIIDAYALKCYKALDISLTLFTRIPFHTIYSRVNHKHPYTARLNKG